jgi:uncharacterized protein (TIGR02679 family)
MANPTESDALVARFRQPDLGRVVVRLVARLRRGKPLQGRLGISAPNESERRAIAGLCGCSLGSSQAIAVDLDALSILATRDGRFASLDEFVEIVHGRPIASEIADRQKRRLAWSELWQHACQRAHGAPHLERWLENARTRSWIRKLAAGDLQQSQTLLESMFKVIEHLPASPPLLLAQLAAEICGDSHALDRDTSLGRLTMRALAARANRPRPRAASEIRALWASAGVVLDELSSTVLVLNLRASAETPLGDVLNRLQIAGEPGRLTFRQLLGQSPCEFLIDNREVYVCENPAVVAAAANRWGADCRPLVCVEGQPNLAADRLLHLFVMQGISLRYHGDFDWGGIRIAARLWHRFRFIPWRFTCDDYLRSPVGRTLTGRPANAPWDQGLTSAMQLAGTAVHEEAVVGELVTDLCRRPKP